MERTFVSIGGGIGSFCFADALKVHGVPSGEIGIITTNDAPYSEFKKFCISIGLTEDKKLRSDSGSRPDNFWGFPGYGLEKSSFADKIKLLFEPLYGEYFNPTARQVYESIDKEAERIGYSGMIIEGKTVSITKLSGGGFRVSCKNGRNSFSVKCRHLHLSLGHGNFARTYRNNFYSAYSLSESDFERISNHSGKVYVVGRGTSAQCIVERLLLSNNKYLKVVSVFNGRPSVRYDNRGKTQKTLFGWRLQHFNWPRAAFSGPLLNSYKNSRDRGELYNAWSCPTAIPRQEWIKLLKDNYKSGRYDFEFGDVAKIHDKSDIAILATGFKNDLPKIPLYADMIRKYKLKTNIRGGFRLDKHFRIPAMSSRGSNLFVSGIAADGNSYGPVDSFFGQQYLIVQYIKLLSKQGYLKKLGMINSFAGWIKWMRSEQI